MKFIATNHDRVSEIPVSNNQIIFSRDERVIYMDAENQRTAFTQIMTLNTDEARQNLLSPVSGFYFVEETAILWKLTDGDWRALNEMPEDRIYFMGELPPMGTEEKVYIVDNIAYQWNGDDNSYIQINQPQWENIQ